MEHLSSNSSTPRTTDGFCVGKAEYQLTEATHYLTTYDEFVKHLVVLIHIRSSHTGQMVPLANMVAVVLALFSSDSFDCRTVVSPRWCEQYPPLAALVQRAMV